MEGHLRLGPTPLHLRVRWRFFVRSRDEYRRRGKHAECFFELNPPPAPFPLLSNTCPRGLGEGQKGRVHGGNLIRGTILLKQEPWFQWPYHLPASCPPTPFFIRFHFAPSSAVYFNISSRELNVPDARQLCEWIAAVKTARSHKFDYEVALKSTAHLKK